MLGVFCAGQVGVLTGPSGSVAQNCCKPTKLEFGMPLCPHGARLHSRTHPEAGSAWSAWYWQVIPAVRVSLESARKRGEPKHWARASDPDAEGLHTAKSEGWSLSLGAFAFWA